MKKFEIKVKNKEIEKIKESIEESLQGSFDETLPDLSTDELVIEYFQNMIKNYASSFVRTNKHKKAKREALQTIVVEPLEFEE